MAEEGERMRREPWWQNLLLNRAVFLFNIGMLLFWTYHLITRYASDLGL